LAILGVHGSGQGLEKAYRRRGDQREAFQGRMDGGVKQPFAIADSDRSATGRRKVKGENGGVLRGQDQSKPHLLSTSPLRTPRVTYFARVVLDVLSQAASYGTFDFSSQGQFVPACWGRLTGMWLCPKQWCAANFAFRRSSMGTGVGSQKIRITPSWRSSADARLQNWPLSQPWFHR